METTTRFNYKIYSKLREREFEKIHDRWDDSRGTRVNWDLLGNVLEKKNTSSVIPINDEQVKESVIKKTVRFFRAIYHVNFKKSKPYKV